MSKRTLVLVVLGVGLGVAVGSAVWLLYPPSAVHREVPPAAPKYHCPMHPTMISDRPGDCPICGMRLVPLEARETERVDALAAAPVPAGNASDTGGRTAVRIPAAERQLIGVATSPATRSRLVRSVRAFGRVTYDETRLHHLHTKVSGYVERLHADTTGALVKRGQPLLEIYSPELLASQEEYLIALRARDRFSGSPVASVAETGNELLASARRRLELFDLGDEQILELERTRRPRRSVTLYAPQSGSVIQRSVTQGEKVDADRTLLDLADLSRVWVLASVYEYELPFVRVGQRGTMRLPYVPGKILEGRVTFLYPVLDATTRTVQVRLEFPNPDLLLKPEMYAEVVLEGDLGEGITVPESAVIETGTRSLVFVDRGEGSFEPREVEVGTQLDDRLQVLSGLAEGDSVVTSGNFFVDSESRLEAALGAMVKERPAISEPHRH